MILRIVHLSDFHLSNGQLFDLEHYIVRPLIDDLEAFHSERPVDLVVCSGDLIDKGGISFQSPSEAFDAFMEKVADPLLERLGLSRGDFIIVPGNHDIVRNRDLAFADEGMHAMLDTVDKVDDLIAGGLSQGVERLSPFKEFYEQFYQDSEQPFERGSLHASFRYERGGRLIGVSALNSAWRCFGEHDEGRLLIGRRQVTEAINAIEDCDYRIGVVHHPLRFLRPFDRSAIEGALYRGYHLFLRGHVHETRAEATQLVDDGLFISTAPGNLREQASSDSRTYANGYRIVDFDTATLEVTSHSRRYAPQKHRFDPNTDDGDSSGVAVFQLPTTEAIQKRDRERELAATILNQYGEKLNEHLLTYGTDTAAPKEIRDLFVMPVVVYRERDYSEQQFSEESYDLRDLASDDRSLLIQGGKESGKTVLLDRLLTLLTDEVGTFGQVPVRIDFQKLGGRAIESEVNQFLAVGSSQVAETADRHRLVLLIDDITFGEEDARRLEKLKRFKERFPNTRIIATHSQEHAGDLPLGLLEHNEELELRPLNILGFKTRQIRELVQKWFSASDGADASYVERVVSLFGALDIPHTPLSVSIFLWIIEKQEGYRPTNESTMLENFVERLFRKHGAQEIYADQFDFKNKQRLLADLAHLMLEGDEEDYSIRYTEALSFCERYLESRSFEFDPQPILDHFVDVGLFVRHEARIRFRFRCFFEYFLVKRMEYDEAFLELVLHEENFLKFSNEIRYFTGLQRDRVDILDTLRERLIAAFEEPMAAIKAEGSGYDAYFGDVKFLLNALDEGDVLDSVEEGRPTDEELDAIQDTRLDLARPKGIAKKEGPRTAFGRLSRLLNLTARVLRNTEETSDPTLKAGAYRELIACAMVQAVIYRYEILMYIDDHRKSIPREFHHVLDFIADFSPIIMQVSLHQAMGTKKLNKVFRDEIERVVGDGDISDLEKFFSVFLYAENRGKDYLDYVGQFIDAVHSGYMESAIFVKVVSYYYLRSRSEAMDAKLLNLIGDVLVKSKGLPKSSKGRIIAEHRKRKLKLKAKGDDSQIALDM